MAARWNSSRAPDDLEVAWVRIHGDFKVSKTHLDALSLIS